MKKVFSILLLVSVCYISSIAQPVVSINPAVFTAEDEITITVDVTNTGLKDYSGDVWLWSWIDQGCSANCDAPTNVNPATPAQAAAQAMRDPNNANIYTLTFVPEVFYNKSPSEIKRIGLILKGQDWSNGQTSPNAYADVQPLIFVPSVNRTFPSKVSKRDVVSLYLHQPEASDPALKYQTGSFSIEVKAYDGAVQVGSTITVDATNEGDGVHAGRIIPINDFGVNTITKITYQFISNEDSDVKSGVFEAAFLDLN
jgi:hypothetical protein